MNASQIVSFLLVGALAGSLVGALVMRKRSGFGFGLNLFVGLVGALIGGGLFSLLHINLGLLGKIEVNLEDLIAAFAGALILLLLSPSWASPQRKPRRAEGRGASGQRLAPSARDPELHSFARPASFMRMQCVHARSPSQACAGAGARGISCELGIAVLSLLRRLRTPPPWGITRTLVSARP